MSEEGDEEREAKLERLRTHSPTNKTFIRAKKIATVKHWQSFGGDPDMLWGIAIGSSGTYRTLCALDPDGNFTDSECSCPSRERPCKHGLALAILQIQAEEPWPETSPPDGHIKAIESSRYSGMWE